MNSHPPLNVYRVIYLFDVAEIYADVSKACTTFRHESNDRDCPKVSVLVFLWFVHHLRKYGHMLISGHGCYYELWNYGLTDPTAINYVHEILHGLPAWLSESLARKVSIATDHRNNKIVMHLTPRVLELVIDLRYPSCR